MERNAVIGITVQDEGEEVSSLLKNSSRWIFHGRIEHRSLLSSRCFPDELLFSLDIHFNLDERLLAYLSIISWILIVDINER